MNRLTNDIKTLAPFGLAAPALEKVIMIIDVEGNPLEGAHLTWDGKGTITNYEGEARVTVDNENTQVTISYMGKRSHVAAFKDLGSLITLQENPTGLPPVVVNPEKPKITEDQAKYLKYAAIGLGALILIGMMTSQDPEKKNTEKKKD